MIRVVIADDHHLVRQSIRTLLNSVEDIEVVGEAADGQEVIKKVQHLVPDVAILDIAMPLLNGIEAAKRIRSLHLPTQLLILSMYADEQIIREALQSGVRGYLLKNSLAEEMLLAIRYSVQGGIYLSPAITRTVLTEFLQAAGSDERVRGIDDLSTREREVLQMIVEGHTNHHIGQFLNISTKTVEKHRANLMKKLDAHNLPALIRVALKNRLIFLDE